jgi:hypothetical protein
VSWGLLVFDRKCREGCLTLQRHKIRLHAGIEELDLELSIDDRLSLRMR